MLRFGSISRTVATALFLGVAALSINYAVLTSTDQSLRIGDLILLISALALGVRGALISVAVGLLPETLQTADHLEFLRMFVLCSALGFFAERTPRIPGFIVALGMWVVLFAPAITKLHLQISHAPFQPNDPQMRLLALGLKDVLMTLVAGTLLQNASIWGALTQRPRRTTLEGLLVHVTCLVVCMLLLLGIQIIGATNVHIAAQALASLSFAAVVIPCLVAWRMAVVIRRYRQEFFAGNILQSGDNRTFSGLASDYWRRQNSSVKPEPTERDLALTTPISSDSDRLETRTNPLLKNRGICALSADGTITFVNRKFGQYAEVKNNEVLGRKLEMLSMHPAVAEALQDLITHTYKVGPRTVEVKVNQLPERLRFFELVSMFSDSLESTSSINSGADGIIITINDITERRTIESQLLQAQKMGSLGKLAGGIAHAFNNALTTIVGQASVAKRMQDKAKLDLALTKILASAARAGDLVNQLLDFSETSRGLLEEEDLNRFAEHRLQLLRQMIGVDYEISFAPSPRTVGIRSDLSLLTQALTNLVMNACESYSGKSGKVQISIEREHIEADVAGLNPGTRPGHFARLRVRDFGCGMNQETLGNAFNPLFTTKSSSGHTGLGLSTVFAIVRAHDGFLTVESKPEKGTTVSIYLPLHDLSAHEALKTAADQDTPIDPLPQGQNEGVLVVEDDTHVRDLMCNMLASLGYSAVACGSGEEALAQCEKRKFDLLLVDMVMPKMNGSEVIAKVRGVHPTIKTLMMTGYGVNHPGLEGDVIAKPFDIDSLASAIHQSLHGAL